MTEPILFNAPQFKNEEMFGYEMNSWQMGRVFGGLYL